MKLQLVKEKKTLSGLRYSEEAGKLQGSRKNYIPTWLAFFFLSLPSHYPQTEGLFTGYIEN